MNKLRHRLCYRQKMRMKLSRLKSHQTNILIKYGNIRKANIW